MSALVDMPPQIHTPRRLVFDDLGRLLTVEEMLARVAIPKLLQAAQDDELRDALEQHRDETLAHADAIRRAFESLGETPKGRPAPGLDGLLEEQVQIATVALGVRDSFAAGAAMGADITRSPSTRACSRSPSRCSTPRRRGPCSGSSNRS